MALPTVHQDEVDGVPVFWVESGRPTLGAVLLFRCGIVDETLPTTGWTHLVEHLALHGRERGALHVNGSTGLLRTTFEAHGPAAEVARVLAEITRWLAEPALARVADESRVLQAEAEYRGTGDAAVAMLQRFGARGPGLVGYSEPGLSTVTPEGLAEHVARRFTAGNAVLVLDGPPPPGLRLHLSPGTPLVVPAPPTTTSDPRPAAYATAGRLVLSGEVPRTAAATLLPAVLQRRLHSELRDAASGAYAPWSSYEAVGVDTAVVLAGSDVAQAFLPSVARQVTATLAILRVGGPRQELLDDVVAQTLQSMRDPYQGVSFAYAQATATLESRPLEEPEEALDHIAAVSREELTSLLEAFSASLLLGVPGSARWDDELPVLRMPTHSQPLAGRRHRSREFPAERTQVVVGADGVAMGLGESWQHVRAAEVVAVMAYPDGGRRLVAADGWGLAVEPALWRDGGEAVRGVDAMVPDALRIPMHPRDPDRVPRPASLVSVLRRSLRPALPGLVLVLVVVVGLALFVAGLSTGHPALLVPLVVGVVVGVREWRSTGRSPS